METTIDFSMGERDDMVLVEMGILDEEANISSTLSNPPPQKRVRFADNIKFVNEPAYDEKENVLNEHASPNYVYKNVLYKKAPKSPGKALKYKRLEEPELYLAKIAKQMFIDDGECDLHVIIPPELGSERKES